MKSFRFLIIITLLFFTFTFVKGQSDNCSSATLLSVNSTCVNTTGTTIGATQNIPGCAGTADDDVWYRFVATNSFQTITVHPHDLSMDPVLQLFSGSCGTLVSLYCMDNGFDGDDEIIYATGLTVGATYYVRVYHYYSGSGSGIFDICVQGSALSTPSNDNPCSAIPLPAVTSACNYLQFTTTGATATTGVATPSGCTGGSAPQQGGWSSSSKDVWFTIVVPASGELVIAAKPSGVGITDAVMALYSGTCSSLTQLECYDDYSHPYPTVTSLQPMIIRSGLTPGATLYLRFWGYGTTSGTFGICVSTPTNDDCNDALYICDLNGYSGTTSGAYTPDYPDNMDGTWAGTWTQGSTSYTSSGSGPFGWGHSPADVQINNNSWIRFTAAAPTATLNVTVSDCWKTTPLGVQMQIFSANNCTNFDTVSNFSQSTSTLTITARNLTIGEDYYLMVDGFAGDICNYTIKASGGILFSGITASDNDICLGQSVTLTGPADASSYEWLHNGAITQSVVVTPTSVGSITYTLYAYGACGAKQTLTTTINVNAIPVANAGSDKTICRGSSTNLSASGGTGYSWSPTTGLSSTNISNPTANPTSTTTYVVTVTSSAGCTATDNVKVTVNPLPIVNAGSDVSIPNGTNTILSSTASGGSGSYTYSWSPIGSLVNANIQNPTTTNLTSTTLFTLTVTDNVTGCQSTDQVLISITGSPLSANANASATTICYGQSSQLFAMGSGGSGSYTYNWASSPVGFNSTSQSPTVTPISTTSYYVTVSDGFNTATSSVQVTVNPLPNANAGNDVAICSGNSTAFNASGGNSYSWSPSTGLSATNISNPNASPGMTTTYIVTVTNSYSCSATDNITVTVNNLPTANAGANATICSGLSTNLAATGGVTYAWSPSGGLSSSTISNPIASPSNTTTYIVTITNSAGCTASDNVIINVNQTPLVNAGSDVSIANGTFTTLSGSASGGSGSYTFNWTPTSLLSNPNVQNPTTTNLSSTTIFTLTVIDNITGCQATDQITVTVTGGALNTSAASNPTTICSGQSVQLYALASGGSGVYTYTWASSPVGFSSNNSSPSDNPVGNTIYMLTVSDGFNSVTTNVFVTVNPTPAANAGNDIAICSGSSTGLNASGGDNYIWSPSTGLSAINVASPTASPSSTTQYTVTVTNSYGCSDTDDILVTVNPVPNAVAGSDFSICTGSSANLNASGGTVYLWNPSTGLNNPAIANPIATPVNTVTYIVTATNAQGCTDSDDITVTVNSLPMADAGNDQAICVGRTAALNASGGSSYSWSPSATLSNSGISNPVANPTSTTAYTVTVTDANGCSATDFTTLTVNPLPSANAGSDASICSGNAANLIASGGTSYSWSPSAGLSNTAIANPVASPTSTTTYSVTVSDINSCSNTDDIIVTVFPLPTASAGSDTVMCTGDSVLISASGGVSYTWNSGDSVQSFVVSPLATSTYIVTVTDANGCTNSDDIIVTANTTPVITLASDLTGNVIYTGQLFVVTVDPASYDIYNFYVDTLLVQSGQSNSFSSASLSNGQTIYILANDDGCVSNTDSLSIEIKQIPNAFTPRNNDGVNDLFLKNLDITVFNRWGEKLYEGKDGWDGKYNGNYVSKGTYYFAIKFDDLNGNISEIKGSITVVN